MNIKALVIALGCITVGCNAEESATEGTTWYDDVLPVAQKKCLGCHNDEAPTFSMERYSEALASRAKLIAQYTSMGVMPPWKPSSECNHYDGERTLTEDEIALFNAWSDGGALEGDSSKAPPVEEPVRLEHVDVSLKMDEPYLPAPAEGELDDLHCFVFDPQLTEDRYMVGFDVRPGERRVVHHALLYLADADADALDAADPGPGYECFGGPMTGSGVVVAGWVPGMPPNIYPADTGIPISAGSRFVLQLHYNVAQAGPLSDNTSVDLQLADAPPSQPAVIARMTTADFAVPPHTDGYTVDTVMDVPANANVWAVGPHMHLLGQRALVEVERSDGSSSCLVDIPDWDFNWQQFYFLQQPLQVSVGDRVRLTCTWNNDTDATVTWGEGTGSEMCGAFFYATERK